MSVYAYVFIEVSINFIQICCLCIRISMLYIIRQNGHGREILNTNILTRLNYNFLPFLIQGDQNLSFFYQNQNQIDRPLKQGSKTYPSLQIIKGI